MNKSTIIEEYINTPLIYDGKKTLNSDVINNYGGSIMDNQEDLIMERSADVLFKNNPKSVLNIGHGLGIIDTYIKSHNPENHTIIELHPDAAEFARSNGFENVINTDWREYVEECVSKGIKFDSIYFDTYIIDPMKHEWLNFSEVVDSILNDGGIFCWFNGIAAENCDYTLKVQTKYPDWQLHSEIISIFDIMDRCRDNGNTDFDWKSMRAKNYSLNWFVK